LILGDLLEYFLTISFRVALTNSLSNLLSYLNILSKPVQA